MSFGAVQLVPGVNVERTLSGNQAGVSVAQLLRYRQGMIETLGGWEAFVPFTLTSTARDLHPWQDAAGVKHLAIGMTQALSILTDGSNKVVTPQTYTTNNSAAISVTAGSCLVTIVDATSSGIPSIYTRVFFETPVAISGLLLNGAYEIVSVLSTNSYNIRATEVATSTSTTAFLPGFNTVAGDGRVTVTLPNNDFLSVTGLFYSFYAPTTVGGITIQGPYQVQSIIDSTSFIINSPDQATSNASATMNSSLVRLTYYVTIGPPPSGTGWGFGGWGSGGWGGAIASPTPSVAGNPITAEDWTMDNFGQVLLACPMDGAIYAWSPDNGFDTAQVITSAPLFNGGIFVSMPQQIVVAWRSGQEITGTQSPLLVRWSDAEDYTNWETSNQTTAGSFVIPTGSLIVGGIQGPSQGVIWTDIDCWVMRYVGGTVIFNFTRVGGSCGAVGPHCMGVLNGVVYWMGQNNFFMLSDRGVQVIPCTVWDFVFQNFSEANISKARCAPNGAFNEVAWFFPSTNATENDSYVKYNAAEGEWDYGTLARTAWCDVSVLGNPIGVTPGGTVYQHEEGTVNAGANATSFQSGWWTISEGSDLAFVDFVIPDFKYGKFAGSQNANIQVTFFSVNYPGDTPQQHGPFTVTSATEYIPVRIRGRLMSVQVNGDGLTFFRLGRIRFRFAVDGRR